ncbi:MAG: FAD:protein FMN transferase [Bacilli bacterium]|jgi:thiamine biosynthesis lipoprotein
MKNKLSRLKAFLLKLLDPREWTILLSTLLISGLLVSSIFIFKPDSHEFDPDDIPFERIGYDVFAKTSGGEIRNIFNTSYEIRYQKVYPETYAEMARDIYVDNVPFIHKVADCHYAYRLDENNISSPIINNLFVINESYGSEEWLQIPEHLYFLLEKGLELTIATDFKFNIFVGEVVNFWQDILKNSSDYLNRDPYYNPDQADLLERLTSYIPMNQQEVEDTLKLKMVGDDHYVRFNSFKSAPHGDLSITLAGIAKGYANDVLAPLLNENELEHGFIYGGSSSISTLGSKYSGNPWQWQLEGPTEDAPYAFYINRDGQYSFSTSGGYLGVNIPIDDGYILRHHIVDPETGYPADQQLQISLISADLPSYMLDAYSTALMNMTIEEGLELKAFINNQGKELELAWINIIDNDQVEVNYTSGYQQYITELDNLIYHVV